VHALFARQIIGHNSHFCPGEKAGAQIHQNTQKTAFAGLTSQIQ
jgi:hypothetical protein